MKHDNNQFVKQRERMNLTREELVKKLNGAVSLETIGRIERGQRQPRVDTLLLLADALECDPDYLLGRLKFPNREVSEIGEQIPLNEAAIRCLVELNEMCSVEKDNGQNPAFFSIEAELISELISKLVTTIHSRQLMDNTNHKKWDVEEMVRSIWDAEYRDHASDYQTLAMRMSISQAIGSIVYDFIASKKDEALAYYKAIGSIPHTEQVTEDQK